MTFKGVGIFGLSVVVLANAPFAQTPTIPQRVAANDGKPVTIHIRKDASAVPVTAMAAHADLVVVGRLTNKKSYLSEDKFHVYTDYQLIPSRIVVARTDTFTRTSPGSGESITVTVYGGELAVDGVLVTFIDHSRRDWTEGAELLLFLAADKGKSDRFRVYGGAAGAFEVGVGQRVKSLRNASDKDPETEDLPLEQVLRKVQGR